MPSAILRSAYSTTTVAPSTSMPTARISENSTTMLTVRPIVPSTAMPQRNETGTARPTSSDERRPSIATMMIMVSATAASTLLPRSFSMFRMSSTCPAV